MSLTAASVSAMSDAERYNLIRHTLISFEVAAGVSWKWNEVTLAARKYPLDIICAMMLDLQSENGVMSDICLSTACMHKNPDPRVRRYFAYMLKAKLSLFGYDVEKVADGSIDIRPNDLTRDA